MEAEILQSRFYIGYYGILKMEHFTKVVTLYFDTLSHFCQNFEEIPARNEILYILELYVD